VRRRTLTLRAIALLSAGSAAVHQLRYAIGYGNDASHALAAHPHGYLGLALPAVATVTLIALASVLMRVAETPAASTRSRMPLPLVWLGSTLALAAIFGVQETLEGASAVAGGGWIGLVLALPAGLLVALALRGADVARVRVAAAKFRIQIVAATAPPRAPERHPGRLLDLRLGARAPPPSFVA
jgi:hypothetical protein